MAELEGKVDLEKYVGIWEQVSVDPVPNFQKDCKDVKAIYGLLPNGEISVLNVCDDRTVKGRAKSVSDDNRLLKVSFFPFIWGDYKITEIDEDYKNATVQGSKYTWKLRKVA